MSATETQGNASQGLKNSPMGAENGTTMKGYP
jgi:hypothetical protein